MVQTFNVRKQWHAEKRLLLTITISRCCQQGCWWLLSLSFLLLLLPRHPLLTWLCQPKIQTRFPQPSMGNIQGSALWDQNLYRQGWGVWQELLKSQISFPVLSSWPQTTGLKRNVTKYHFSHTHNLREQIFNSDRNESVSVSPRRSVLRPAPHGALGPSRASLYYTLRTPAPVLILEGLQKLQKASHRDL